MTIPAERLPLTPFTLVLTLGRHAEEKCFQKGVDFQSFYKVL